jgi:hypothetical protein
VYSARFVITVVGAGIVSSLTDWFFAGDWLHRRYTYREIWRHTGGKGEGQAIALSSPLPFMTSAAFAYLAVRLGLHSVSATVKVAVAIWLIGPLPIILTCAAFIKLHRVFVMSLSIGWLVKLTLIAVAVGWFLY